jgi:hypothetical protein
LAAVGQFSQFSDEIIIWQLSHIEPVDQSVNPAQFLPVAMEEITVEAGNTLSYEHAKKIENNGFYHLVIIPVA